MLIHRGNRAIMAITIPSVKPRHTHGGWPQGRQLIKSLHTAHSTLHIRLSNALQRSVRVQTFSCHAAHLSNPKCVTKYASFSPKFHLFDVHGGCTNGRAHSAYGLFMRSAMLSRDDGPQTLYTSLLSYPGSVRAQISDIEGSSALHAVNALAQL
jgi:hypothetical protein